jgi:hypothetical protein
MGRWQRLASSSVFRTARGTSPPPDSFTPAERLSFSFAGAAYGWPYYCGVAAFVQRHRLLSEGARLYACSAGNVAGLYLAADVDAANEGFEMCAAANESHMHPRFGPWFRPAHARRAFFEVFAPVLPSDAHVRASGRLHVLVTQVIPLLRRRVVSHFGSRDALVATVAASMAIPGHGVRFAFRHPATEDLGWCLDGGLLGSLADDDRPGWRTVRVSVLPLGNVPGLRRVDIAPSPGLGWRQMLTIESRAARRELYTRGYDDTGAYFDRMLAARAPS